MIRDELELRVRKQRLRARVASGCSSTWLASCSTPARPSVTAITGAPRASTSLTLLTVFRAASSSPGDNSNHRRLRGAERERPVFQLPRKRPHREVASSQRDGVGVSRWRTSIVLADRTPERSFGPPPSPNAVRRGGERPPCSSHSKTAAPHPETDRGERELTDILDRARREVTGRTRLAVEPSLAGMSAIKNTARG